MLSKSRASDSIYISMHCAIINYVVFEGIYTDAPGHAFSCNGVYWKYDTLSSPLLYTCTLAKANIELPLVYIQSTEQVKVLF